MNNKYTQHPTRLHTDAGFTLLEILTAMLIFGLLAAIAIPSYLSQREAVASERLEHVLTSLSLAVERDGRLNNGDYPAVRPADVAVPVNIHVAYFQGIDGTSWCAEAFDHDTEDKTTFRIGGQDNRVSSIEQGKCNPNESNLPLDTPVLEPNLSEGNEAMLHWSPVPSAETYELRNLTTGELFTMPAGGTTVWRSQPLEEPQKFQLTATASDRANSVSRVIEVRPFIRVIDYDPAPQVTWVHNMGMPGFVNFTATWTFDSEGVENPIEYIIYATDADTEVARIPHMTADKHTWNHHVTETTWFHVTARYIDGSESQASVPFGINVVPFEGGPAPQG